jgi:tetratricopeptide (TPR) repeat protein
MRVNPGIFILMAALSAVPGVGLASGSGSMGGGSTGSMGGFSHTPEDRAKDAYNSGVRSIKKAKDCEADAAKASTDEKRSKALEKARKNYSEALPEFIAAVAQQPSMYQAWNYIGFTNRHLGNYDAALSAYAKALELNPTYAEAIEYRGEAYLGLNQVAEAKDAYMVLFRDSRGLADQLMTAMHQWADAHRKDAQGLPTEDIEAFSKWLDERSGIAAQTASLGRNVPVNWK